MYRLYSIYNRSSKTYTEPFLLDGEDGEKCDDKAIGLFNHQVDASQYEQSDIFHSPENYDLFLLGTFDDQKGVISPACVCVAFADSTILKRIPVGDHPLFNGLKSKLSESSTRS